MGYSSSSSSFSRRASRVSFRRKQRRKERRKAVCTGWLSPGSREGGSWKTRQIDRRGVFFLSLFYSDRTSPSFSLPLVHSFLPCCVPAGYLKHQEHPGVHTPQPPQSCRVQLCWEADSVDEVVTQFRRRLSPRVGFVVVVVGVPALFPESPALTFAGQASCSFLSVQLFAFFSPCL